MKRNIALLLIAGVVLVVMRFAMSPGVAIGAKAGGVPAKAPCKEEGKKAKVVAKVPFEEPPIE